MPMCPVVPQGQPSGSSDTACQIGNAVLTHLDLSPAEVNRFYSKPIGDKLLLVLKAGTEEKRWMLMDADGLSKSEPLSTEQLLKDLLSRSNLTEQQRNGIQAS